MILPAIIRLTASQWVWATAALILAVAAVVFYYWRTVPPLSRGVKAPLVALRVIAAIALFLALADALWVSLKHDEQLHDLLVITDRSASMDQTDGQADNRLRRAEEYFERWIDDRLSKRANIHHFYFDDGLLAPDSLPDSLGSSTALGSTLSELADRAQELNPRATVVLSDGASNRGIDPLEAANRLGVPVIAVGMGDAVGAQARVVGVDVPEVVLTDRPFQVSIAAQSGSVDETVTLRLATGGRTVVQEALNLAQGGVRTTVDLAATVTTPGMHSFRLDVVGSDGRATPTAGRTLFVRALKGRLKVLLIGGVLDWEYTYLKRWLNTQSRVDLTAHVIGSPQLDAPAPTASQWSDADIAIWVHPSRAQLDAHWAAYADRFTAPGRGVVFLLDSRFTAASARPSPYPFDFMRTSVADAHGEFTLDPLPTRQNHPIVRFDPSHDWSQTLDGWAGRPPWVLLNCFQDLPQDADVLVRAVQHGVTGDCPAVWTRLVRGGKALVLTGGPLWRWVSDRALRGEDAREYDAFWGNTVRWLSLRDETDRLAVRTDRQIYYVGEPITLDASVYDEAYRFLDRAEVTSRIWPDTTGGDTLSLFLPPGAGNRFVGHVSHLPPGNYRYDGTAVVDGVELPLVGDIFRIEPYGLEQRDYSLNEAQLRRIAVQTRGRFYREGEQPAVLDSMDWTASVRETLVEFPLWNHTALLVIFVVALSAEWFIRRRKQLL